MVKKSEHMNKDTTKEWMDKLVKNYRIPDEQPKEKKEPVRMLKESQLRIIMERDKKDLDKKK
jgi:hypothetical protein